MKSLGQYFTTSPLLQQAVYSLILNNPTIILEPSVGRGDLVQYILSKQSVAFDCYEIDPTVEPVIPRGDITFMDFLAHPFEATYPTIIGNPPYVKKRTRNLYIDFIEKCVTLLQDGGELVFIVPSDTFKLTSSIPVIRELFSMGHLTHIIHPHDEHLFKDATIDVIVFRYVKGTAMGQTGQLDYNGQIRHYYYNDFLYTFANPLPKHTVSIETHFTLHVGMVSGCEAVFKHHLGQTQIVTDIGTDGHPHYSSYIFTMTFPTDDEIINNHLLSNKATLCQRRIRIFHEDNWYEWGAIRNMTTMTQRKGEPCIFIRNITRKPIVATIGTVDLFSGNIMCLIPKTPTPLEPVVAFLNSPSFKDNFTYSGRFRVSHKQLAKCCLFL